MPGIVRDKKVLVLREMLGSDVNRLTDLLLQICERHRRHRDYSRHQLADALRELIAWFPVYRTYIQPYSSKLVGDGPAIRRSGDRCTPFESVQTSRPRCSNSCAT